MVNVTAYKCKTRVSLPTRGRQRKRRKSVKEDVPILHLFCGLPCEIMKLCVSTAIVVPLTLLLPNVAKGKFRPIFQISFSNSTI